MEKMPTSGLKQGTERSGVTEVQIREAASCYQSFCNRENPPLIVILFGVVLYLLEVRRDIEVPWDG